MGTEAEDNVIPITSQARSAAQAFGQAHDRELLTILFTDLCDSTKLQSDLGNIEAARLTELHRKIVRDELASYDAREIEWAGDSCLAVFTKPSDGVIFALKLQAVLRDARAAEPDMPIVRIGLHLGEIVVRRNEDAHKDDLFGLQVSEAARVMSLASGNQIYCTRAVFDNAHSALKRQRIDGLGEVEWLRHGFFELKGSDEPAEVFEVGETGFAPLAPPEANDKCRPIRGDLEKWRKRRARGERTRRGIPAPTLIPVVIISSVIGAIVMWMAYGSSARPPITSIAVLPLENLMNDPGEDYFVDGMTDAITAELGKISSLKVISRTSAMQYRHTDKSLPEIARELGVAGLIEGSVMRDGDDVQIAVRLIDGRDDRHLWSQKYTNTVSSVLKLQADVALAIADEVRAEIEPEERQRIADKADVKPAALEAYLRGRQLMRSREGDDMLRAAEQFRLAADIDPKFASAHAGIADVYLLLGVWGFRDPKDVYEDWRDNIEQALSLDSSLAEAQASYGMGKFLFEMDVETSFAAFRKAILLEPNDARNHHWYGVSLDQAGRIEEGLERLDHAAVLDPKSQIIQFSITLALMNARRFSEADEAIEALFDEAPDFVPGYQALIMLRVAQGRMDEAVAAGLRFAALRNNDSASLSVLSMAQAAAGHDRAAIETLERANESAERVGGGLPFDYQALVPLYLGNKEEALDTLEQMDRTPTLFLSVNPLFDALRDEPRFWEVVERMGYPPLPAEHPVYPEQHAFLVRREAERLLKEQGLGGTPRIESLAVLPLDNYSDEPEQQYFVDGMTDVLTAELSKVGSLKVIARTSAMRYKESGLEAREIARELDVDGLIEGSVYRSGNEVSITVRLVHGATQQDVWSANYNEPIENVIALQGRVAVAIMEEISAAITPEEERRIRLTDTTNSAAADAYFRAQYALRSRSREAFELAIVHFEDSIRNDPDFAPSYAGIAQVRALQVGYSLGDPEVYTRLSREAAEQALKLNSDLAEAHAALGLSHTSVTAGAEHWPEAEAHFRKAIVSKPGYALAHSWLGMLYTQMGRLDSGLTHLERGVELDPKGLVPRTLLAENYIYRREYDKAEALLNAVLEDDPKSLLAASFLETLFSARGYTESRVEQLERVLVNLDSSIGFGMEAALATAYAQLGRRDEAQAILQEILSNDAESRQANIGIPVARIWFALGDYERGFEHLRMPDQFRSFWPFIRSGPGWDFLRDDRRYWELMRDQGFPPFPPGHPLYEQEQEWLVLFKAEELIQERGLVAAGASE